MRGGGFPRFPPKKGPFSDLPEGTPSGWRHGHMPSTFLHLVLGVIGNPANCEGDGYFQLCIDVQIAQRVVRCDFHRRRLSDSRGSALKPLDVLSSAKLARPRTERTSLLPLSHASRSHKIVFTRLNYPWLISC